MEFMALIPLAWEWTGIGTASGSAFIAAAASFILAVVALVTALRKRKNGKDCKNGKDGQ